MPDYKALLIRAKKKKITLKKIILTEKARYNLL